MLVSLQRGFEDGERVLFAQLLDAAEHFFASVRIGSHGFCHLRQ